MNSNNIKLILTDIDGVFTDNTVTYDKTTSGKHTKSFNYEDFTAITLLRKVRPDVEIKVITSDLGNSGHNISMARFVHSNLLIDAIPIEERISRIKEIIAPHKSSEFIFVGDSVRDAQVARLLKITNFAFPSHSFADRYRRVFENKFHPFSGRETNRSETEEWHDIIQHWYEIGTKGGFGAFASLIYQIFQKDIFGF